MVDDLNNHSKEELISIISDYRNGYKAEAYNFLRLKLKETIDAFNNKKIDVASDDGSKIFENYIKFSKEIKKMTEAIEEMARQIDPTINQRLRSKQEEAADFSPEWLASQKDD